VKQGPWVDAWAALAGLVMAVGFILACRCSMGCAQFPGPTVPDSAIDGGCALDDKITSARVIANPDGTPLVTHCDAGAP
jgi:hypothetical protein